LLTGTNALIGGGKEGRVYVVSTTNMGQFTADPNLTCNGSAEEKRTDIDKIQQELTPGTVGSLFSTPAFWNGPNGQYVYFPSVNGPTRAFSWSNGNLSTTPTSTTAVSFGFTGGDAVVSSNGTAPGTGILWTIDSNPTLRAYDASNLANELYDSNQNASRDGLSGYVKYSTVAVANGEAFVGTAANLVIFGLLSSGLPTPTPTTTKTPTPTPTPAGGIQINVGGPAVAPFAADTDSAGGATAATSHAIDTSAVSNPAPQAVYQSNRSGNFTYALPGLTANGSYTVRLHFAETYWTAAGQRIFNVSLNDRDFVLRKGEEPAHPSGTWGAFPGHPIENIESGNGVVHNSLMFAHPQKSVLRAPFRGTPTPTWFASEYGKASKVFPKLVKFEAAPSPFKMKQSRRTWVTS
jgi:hypothetical protein